MSQLKTIRHISVTLDFLRQLPELDVRKDKDLHQALYLVGFDIATEEDGNLSKVEMLHGVNVRCADRPYELRKTTVFVGRMRQDYKLKGLYDNVDILDIGATKGIATQLVSEMAYDIPVVEKVNTRKYTKRQDNPSFLDVAPEDLDTEALEEIFGGEHGSI